jgi:hypothetical protein
MQIAPKYLNYEVGGKERALLEMQRLEHPMIKDPGRRATYHSWWDKLSELYMNKQSVRIHVPRFTPTLA